jgi:TPR repeat protein
MKSKMNSLSKKNIATVFKILTLSFLLFSSNIVKAQVIEFECDNAKFNVDISGSQVIRPGMEITSIDWQFDGEWLRWKTKPNDESFGINIKNGYLITTSSTSQQNCKILSQYDLRKIPISKGAVLRRNFIKLSYENRKYAQQCLSSLGYYNSTIDGLWGAGTELAVMQFYEDRKSAEFLNKDITIQDDASFVILSLLDTTQSCNLQTDGCDECNEGSDFIAPDLDEALKLWNSGRREEAVRIWEAGKALGMPRALFNFGFLHRDGLVGYSQDYTLAAKYYKQAAEGGYYDGWWSGGYLFREEKLAAIERKESQRIWFSWHKNYFKIVTDKYGFDPQKYDNELTIGRIAILFEEGNIVTQDRKTAYEWYQVAASRGVEFAIRGAERLTAYAPTAPTSQSRLDDYKVKCNGYSTILGLCWALSASEMKAVIQSRDFRLVEDNRPRYRKTSGGGDITLGRKTISFDCILFNACPLTPREIAQKLMSAGLVVGDMENTSTTYNGIIFETYCGRGVKGEKICVQAGKIIEMSKGVVGKDVSFN